MPEQEAPRYEARDSTCDQGCCGYPLIFDTRSGRVAYVLPYEFPGRDVRLVRLNEGSMPWHDFTWESIYDYPNVVRVVT